MVNGILKLFPGEENAFLFSVTDDLINENETDDLIDENDIMY